MKNYAAGEAARSKAPLLAVPQLGSRASPGRTMRLWEARYSQGEAQPLGAQPSPRGLERAASKVAYLSAFVHAGGADESESGGCGEGGVIGGGGERRFGGGGGGAVAV